MLSQKICYHCMFKASITVSDTTPQRISILISLLWCGIIFIIIVVAMCKSFYKIKGDVTGQAQSLAVHLLSSLMIQQALHWVLWLAEWICCYLVIENCSASPSYQITNNWLFFPTTGNCESCLLLLYIVWHCFIWFLIKSQTKVLEFIVFWLWTEVRILFLLVRLPGGTKRSSEVL